MSSGTTLATELSARFNEAKKALFDKKIYARLNDRQREAVYSINGPLLILAGAGSGKTTVLVNRISHIIRYGDAYNSDNADITEKDVSDLTGALDDSVTLEDAAALLEKYAVNPCPPWAVLSITFTNKAAGEMKERLTQTIGERAAEIWSGTFHSIALRMLRKYCESIGYDRSFTIYDTDDSKKMITNVMKALDIDEKSLMPKAVMTAISRYKDKLMKPADAENDAGSDFKLKQIARIYAEYQKRMLESNVMDFDDIIMQTVRLLTENKEARDWCQNRFKYVCVDEYQDTNRAQFELVKAMSGRYMNLMVVGDDDQSIYKFRGATIENILNFERDLDGAKVVKLEQNYRSTQNILSAANAVIRNNEGRRGKELWTDSGEGEKIRVKKLDNQTEESKYIINKIMEMVIREKRRYSDFAVLYRMNAQSNSLEQIFSRSGIAYRVLGGQRFFERKEIKDILAYLCVINNPADNLRLRRIINEPKRKIGDATVNAVESIAAAEATSMFEIMKHADRYVSISKSANKLQDFTLLIEGLRHISENEKLSLLFERTIDLSGYRAMLISEGEEAADRLQNVSELISNAVDFENTHEDASLAAFLEEMSLVTDIDNYDEAADAVTLMTIHSAKGLEFPVVFLPGFEEGIFPGIQATMFPEDLEEERRLAYVAMTRAKEKLFITHARERLLFGRSQYNQVSRFVGEIPEELIETDQSLKKKNPEPREKHKKPVISKEFFSKSELTKNGGKSVAYERFTVGEDVSHASFGHGKILSVKSMGSDTLYEIVFDDVGTKKLMATYVDRKSVV